MNLSKIEIFSVKLNISLLGIFSVKQNGMKIAISVIQQYLLYLYMSCISLLIAWLNNGFYARNIYMVQVVAHMKTFVLSPTAALSLFSY